MGIDSPSSEIRGITNMKSALIAGSAVLASCLLSATAFATGGGGSGSCSVTRESGSGAVFYVPRGGDGTYNILGWGNGTGGSSGKWRRGPERCDSGEEPLQQHRWFKSKSLYVWSFARWRWLFQRRKSSWRQLRHRSPARHRVHDQHPASCLKQHRRCLYLQYWRHVGTGAAFQRRQLPL